MDVVANFEKLLAEGKDSVMLRFGLGNAYLSRDEYEQAIPHLERAVEQDPAYSAAWKLLGKALAGAGRAEAATTAFSRGIEVAEQKGDIQAAKEMKVFLKRLANPSR